MSVRSLQELTTVANPAWPVLQGWIRTSACPVEVLPVSAARESELVGLQMTVGSPLGAVVYETGGVLFDSGWLRLLGSGSPRLARGVHSWNQGKTFDRAVADAKFLLVGDDALGGFFAIDGGGISEDRADRGKMFYFAPDLLEWEPLEMPYGEFFEWCCSDAVPRFYEDNRWPDWQAELRKQLPDHAIFMYPPLFSEGPPLPARKKTHVPVSEMYRLHVEMRGDLDSLGPKFRIAPEE